MDFIYYILGIVIGLGSMILVHEAGHLLVAKALRFRVQRFSIGFGKKLLKWQGKETEYSLSVFPLGGYCKFSGDEPDSINSPDSDPRDFYARPPWMRILVVLAGPFANIVFGILLLTIVNTIGFDYTSVPNVVGTVNQFNVFSENKSQTTPAYDAGIQPGDKITGVEGKQIRNETDFRQEVAFRGGQDTRMTLERNGETQEIKLRPAVNPETSGGFIGIRFARPTNVYGVYTDLPGDTAGLLPEDTIIAVNGQPITEGMQFYDAIKTWPDNTPFPVTVRHEDDTESVVTLELLSTKDPEGKERDALNRSGVVLGLHRYHRSYPLHLAFVKSAGDSWTLVLSAYNGIWMIVSSQVKADKVVGGLITISIAAGETFREGWLTFLQFVAFMSCMLAAFNVLPIPLLDGGHIVLSIWEQLTRKRPSKRFLLVWQQVGLVIVVLLFSFAIVSDLFRVF